MNLIPNMILPIYNGRIGDETHYLGTTVSGMWLLQEYDLERNIISYKYLVWLHTDMTLTRSVHAFWLQGKLYFSNL